MARETVGTMPRTPEVHLQNLLELVQFGRLCGAEITLKTFQPKSLDGLASMGCISRLSHIAIRLRPKLRARFPGVDWNGLVRMKRLASPDYTRVRRFWTLTILQKHLLRFESQLEQALAASSNSAAAA